MSSLTDMLISQLGDSGLESLGKTLGANPQATKTATAAALPLLFSALAKNAQSDEGASALNRAIERDHDGSLLDGLASAFTQSKAQEGAGILKHVLGGNRSTAEAGIAAASGLDTRQSGQMLATLAPIVMAALAKQKQSQSLDASGLAGMLAGERGQTQDRLGGLAALLDRDGDGSVADDVLGGIGKLFGK